MQIKKIFFLNIIFFLLSFSLACLAQDAQVSLDSSDLKHEFDTLRHELKKKEGNNAPVEDPVYLMGRVSQLSSQLEAAQNTIKQLQQELNLKNKTVNIINKSNFTDNIDNTDKLNKSPAAISGNLNNVNVSILQNPDKKQLELSSSTIVEQTRQLSKAYNEIEQLKKDNIDTDKFITNIIYQAEKLHIQGKNQEAIAIYEILDKIGVRKSEIYQNQALIYQSLGMNTEADKQYNKLYRLFPNLKTSTQTYIQKK